MFDIDKWQEIFLSIKQHKIRSILTAIGIFWGIFMLIVMLGMGNGLKRGSEYNFRDDAVNSIWVSPGTTKKPYKGLPPGRRIQMTIDDFNRVDEMEAVDKGTPRNNLSGNFTVKHKQKTSSFDVRATYPDHQYIENTIMVNGRFLNDMDIKEKRQVAVIGETVVDDLYENIEDREAAIGTYISIQNLPYKVVGVFTDTGGERELRKIYIPYSTANQIYNYKNRVNRMMFTADEEDVEASKKLTKEIQAQLASVHNFDPSDKNAVFIRNNIENFERFMALFGAIEIIIWIVGIFTLLAGIIGVGNIMLIIVKERTKEIGVRKALGATPWSIVSLILQESIFITSVAGYFGLVAGIGVLELINSFLKASPGSFFRDPTIDFRVAVIATIILVICGGLAGLVPALKAARVNPVVAMRDE